MLSVYEAARQTTINATRKNFLTAFQADLEVPKHLLWMLATSSGSANFAQSLFQTLFGLRRHSLRFALPKKSTPDDQPLWN